MTLSSGGAAQSPQRRPAVAEIREFVEKLLAGLDTYAPRQVAREALAELREDNPMLLEAAFDELMEDILRDMIAAVSRRQRMTTARQNMSVLSDQRKIALVRAAATNNQEGTSISQLALLEARQNLLNLPVALPDHTRTVLSKCTVLDLEHLAASAQSTAAANMKWSIFYKGLALALRHHQKNTVGELPPAEVQSVLYQSRS
jgi:hypothetical protein